MTTSHHDVLARYLDAVRDARNQAEYEAAAEAFTEELTTLDDALASQRYLGGASPSPDDWALFPLLVDVGTVYGRLYKLNARRLFEWPNVGPYVRDLYKLREAEVGADSLEAEVDARRRAAWLGDTRRNPKRVLPLGVPDFGAPHDRYRFDALAQTKAGRAGAEKDADARRAKGEFVRGVSAHRGWIGRDLPAEPGRYHLIIANNCPWCHRTALAHRLKQLESLVSVGTLYYRRDAERGWQFAPEVEGFEADALYGHRYVTDYYRSVGSSETSVPLLWDKKTGEPVNNESADIVRMFDEAWPDRGIRLAPTALIPEIDALNAFVYRDINNGAYKAGFSSDQAVYERAYRRFFAALDTLDARLADRRWLVGDAPTEADLRLYPTLFRFDAVYFIRMKLDAKMIRDYRHLSRWLADFGALPGVAEASNLEHCRQGYFGRTAEGFVPIGPRPRDTAS